MFNFWYRKLDSEKMYPNKSDEKIFVCDYKKYPPSRLKNLVKAIKKSTFPLPKPIKTFLSSISIVTLTIGSLGLALPLIFKIKDLSYQIDQENLAEKFYKKIGAKISNGFLKPPSNHPIEMKSKTRSFNHVNDYAIENKILWYRRRGCEKGNEKLGAWKPMYFDSLNQNIWPMSLTVDGANLCVVDNRGDIHYRKILTEARGKNKKKSHLYQMDTPSIRRHLPKDFQSTENYIAIDKSEKANWKPMWYSFPFLNRIINFFTGKRLNVKGQFIISHRGRYNDTYLDADGHQHPTSVGVTTGYELSKDGSTIIKYDPWAPTLSKILFFFPETKEATYSIKKIDVGASCLMAIGHKIDKKTGISKLTLLTNLCDIDILGGNPGLNYAYQTEHPLEAKIRDKDLRILPDEVSNEGWVDHYLPSDLEQPIEFYNQITVIQKPQDQRELRIAAKRGDTLGYYFKDLSPHSSWTFKKYDWIDTNEPIKQVEKRPRQLKIYNPPSDYQGFFKKTGNKLPILVRHFGPRAYHSAVIIKDDNKEYLLSLHRRWGLQNFLGFKKNYYDLVVPKETKFEGKLNQFFKDKRVLPVKVSISKNHGEELIEVSNVKRWF